MAPVLPVLSPQPVGIGTGDSQRRNDGALTLSAFFVLIQTYPAHSKSFSPHPSLGGVEIRSIESRR